MKKLLLGISLFVCASDAIGSLYEMRPQPKITRVGVESHNKNRFSLMITEGTMKYYGQVSLDIVAKIPLLQEEQDKGKVSLTTIKKQADLADLISYMFIRNDISNNVYGAKEGMFEFANSLSAETKSILRTATNALYKEKHSLALLDLPVTKLKIFQRDSYDREKVSIKYFTSTTSASFFQISHEQAKSIGLNVLPGGNFTFNCRAMSEQDFLNFANYVTIRNEEKDYEKLTLFVQGLPATQQTMLMKSAAEFYKESSSLGFSSGIYGYAKNEIALFAYAWQKGDSHSMKAILSRHVIGLVGGVAALCATVLLIYNKLAK